MSILNEGLDWSTFAEKASLRDAFRGTPKKILIPSGDCLCRFITTESEKKGIRGNEIFLSPWWSDWGTTWSMIAKFRTHRVAPREVIRGKLAVTKAFSQDLDGMVQIILKQPVYAWEGPARHQDDAAAGVCYIGGGTQLFLPNLSADRQGLYSEVAYMHCYTSMDSLMD